MAERRCRLVVLASHPVQYFAPIYQALARDPAIDLEVLYCRQFGVVPRYDKQFGQEIRWDTDLLSGYAHRFLWNVSPVSDPFNPLHAINPAAFTRVVGRCDALWVNGYLYPSNYLALAAARASGARLLFRSELRPTPSARRGVARAVRERLLGWWVRQSDALLYIGEENRAAYRAYGASDEQLVFTPYSIDVPHLLERTQAADVAALRRAKQIPVDRPVVLAVGKMTENKHPEAMVHAAARFPGATFVLAGSGPQEPLVRTMIAERGLENVHLLGFVNQSQLPDIYALADVFVLASDRETWGVVLNEAMVAGLVPIVTDGVGAAPDLIDPGETGFVFPTRDWEALNGHLDAVLGNADLRRRIGGAARERARGYGHAQAAQGVREALQRLGLLPRAGAGADALPAVVR